MTQPIAIPTSLPTSGPSTIMTSTPLPTSMPSTTTNAPSNPSMSITLSSSVTSNTNSLSTGTSTTASQNSVSTTFSIITSSTPITIESDVSTVLSTQYLSMSGNVDPSQIIYTVQGNNPDIVITVDGVETNQFTQADVEGNFVEIALQGVTCSDYSTDLQLDANVAGSNAPAQQVNLALTLQGTTCSNARQTSPFSFRDAQVGFWAQKREAEQKPRPEKDPTYIPTFR